MTSLVVTKNVEKYEQNYRKGYDKRYPNLDMVRLEAWYFNKKTGMALDYGCGTGCNMLHLLDCGYRVVGMDASSESIKLVATKLKARPEIQERSALHLIKPNEPRLPCDDESFDYVVCLSVLSLLETHERISQLIAEFHRVLKPGGKMIIDINGPESNFASKGRFVSDDTFEYFLSPDNADPLRCYCPRTKEVFAKLLSAFVIDDVGHVSFEYVGHRDFEFLACVHKRER